MVPAGGEYLSDPVAPGAEAGAHTLRFWAPEPGVVPQRLVLDLGGLKPGYPGPPESPYRAALP
jgi:hypothetical protein